MFTGLVEAVGHLVERTPTAGGLRLRIATALAGDLAPGDSVAVNGVCLTVVRSEHGEVQADIGPETNRVTTLGALPAGAAINLERPLRADGRLGGHFVQGHVDAVGHIEAVVADADFHWITVGFPRHLAPYLIHKGSIAVDGISLTVARLGAATFDVQIVPFTMEHTNLGRAKPRDPVNLECDMVGKYVVRAAEVAGIGVTAGARGEMTH
ncbi:MAG TPA: riboflavin synthase [Vicinamibacterales bacterium]|nr:riboflavin synthase [Vicinamibacterales bacterium]